MGLMWHQGLILILGITGMLIWAGIIGFVMLQVLASMRKALGYDTPFGNLNPRIAGLLAALLGQQAIQPFYSPSRSLDDHSTDHGGDGSAASTGHASLGGWDCGGYDGGGCDGAGDF